MNEKEDVRLDDILYQAQKNQPVAQKAAVSEDEVSAILESLGLGGGKRKDVVRPAGRSALPAAQRAAQRPSGPHLPPPRPQAPARIITAPVTKPVVEHESSTLELPSIKAFSEAQERRRATIERAAAEAALRRAAQEQKRSSYTLPGLRTPKTNLGVEVDDRFRAFFQTSAATEEVESLPTEQPPAKPKKGRKRKAKKAVPQTQELFDDTTSFDAVPLEAQTLEQQSLYNLPSAEKVPPAPPIAWDVVDEPSAVLPPSQKLQQAAQKRAQTVRQQPPQPTAPPASGAPSDTFQLNRFDSAAQQPAPIAWDTVDLPELVPEEIARQEAEQPPIPDDFFEGDMGGAPLPQRGEYREMTVDLPLRDTTDVTGDLLPVYEVGDEDESVSEDEDYNHLADAPAVHAALRNMSVTRVLRLAVTALLAGVLLYLNIVAHLGGELPLAALDPVEKPAVFLAVNLLLLVVSGLACLTTLGGGLSGLFGRPTADSLCSLAVVASGVQLVAYLFKPDAFSPAGTALTAPLAVLLLLFNTLGKWLHSLAVSKNFARASGGYNHAAACLVQSRDLTRAACRGLSEPEPLLLVSRPTELVRGFMRQSFSVSNSDVAARKLSFLLLLGGLLCGVLGGFVTKDVLSGISGAVATICLAAPLASTLLYAVPALRLQREANAVGAVVPGPSAVQNLGLCNTVLLNARELFPAAAVKFHGMQTFEKQRVDLAILYTASILYEKCETLRDVFMQLIDSKKEILYSVDSLQSETGYGFSGWIDHHEVLVGGREMMRRHSVNVPSRDYEQKYTRGGQRCIIYLAVGGKLFGMFVVSYRAMPKAQQLLNELEESGIGILLESDDFNVTQNLLAATYRISPSFVKVLTQPESVMLSGQTEYMPESDGYMTHKGRASSFVGGLQAAARAAAREQLGVMVEIGALLFTLVLCLILTFTLGVENLNLFAMLLYQLAWCAVMLLAPLLKRQ